MFDIRLPLNFNSPYKARRIIDFWQRWHMTLDTILHQLHLHAARGAQHTPSRDWHD